MISLQELAVRYGLRILGMVVVLGFLVYIYHSIYQAGYNDATTKYEARDTKATAEALGILAESKRLSDNQFDKDKLDYENKVKDLNDMLTSTNVSSVPIRTQRTQTCGTGKTNDSQGKGEDVGGTGITELAEYNRGLLKQTEAKIDFMAKELLFCSQKVREVYDVW